MHTFADVFSFILFLNSFCDDGFFFSQEPFFVLDLAFSASHNEFLIHSIIALSSLVRQFYYFIA